MTAVSISAEKDGRKAVWFMQAVNDSQVCSQSCEYSYGGPAKIGRAHV